MKILVIKLAALGDMVQAFSAMSHIRKAHPAAHITLLTTASFAGLATASGLFDSVETDGRPQRRRDLLAMLLRLRRSGYDRVYDLQTSGRSSAYALAFWPRRVDWSGIGWGATLPHANPRRNFMHTLERQADQLAFAGIWPDAPVAPGAAPAPDLSFSLEDTTPELSPAHFGLTAPYALLIPGASPHRPAKRWPAARYAGLATELAGQGVQVAVIGGRAEASAAAEICRLAPSVMDLTGRTDLAQVAALSARAAVVIGNDTGPTHLAAASGAPTIVLFSEDSDPSLCAPRGRRVAVLQKTRLADLEVQTVVEAVRNLRAA